MGRPVIPFDKVLFEDLCNIQCTETEIAATMRISVDTLERRVKEEYGVTFAEVYEQKREGGKESLRRAQWKSAIDGKNPALQIFLGKNILNQSDKQSIDMDLSGDGITIILGDKPKSD
jgi:hypothetical protein